MAGNEGGGGADGLDDAKGRVVESFVRVMIKDACDACGPGGEGGEGRGETVVVDKDEGRVVRIEEGDDGGSKEEVFRGKTADSEDMEKFRAKLELRERDVDERNVEGRGGRVQGVAQKREGEGRYDRVKILGDWEML